MVQRLFEQNPLTRDQVAPALARLLPELSLPMQHWLCQLANPLLPPQANLRTVLDNPRLPAAVREVFAAVCARRAAWWTHIGNKASGPAPVPEPGSFSTDLPAIKAAVEDLLKRATKHAIRNRGGEARGRLAAAAPPKEAAWLLARLTELLQQESLPEPESAGEAVRAGRKRG
jgi:hypothetical protein